MVDGNDGSSYYHALQIRIEKRMSHGLQVTANYSWSRLIERRSLLNASIDVFEKRIAFEDRPHRIVLTSTIELPFGPGKAIGGGAGPFVSRLIGGWALTPMYNFQSGQPLSWGNVIYYGGDLNLDPRNIDHAFDTTRFNTNSAQQLSMNIRTFSTQFSNLRRDFNNLFDVSLSKRTLIKENVRLVFKCDAFNALNHPMFGAPNATPTSSSFGYITSQTNSERKIQMGLRLEW
jgi:hypothetical protein